ncbi:MAG: hypothetical protein NTW28_29270 [Candidatus Solibacter sp.]|nr:hypothetical protein [Candidatus Solibacter sp.]
MIADQGTVKVRDFGQAELVAPVEVIHSEATHTILADSPAMELDTVVGTVSYTSPEQAEGTPGDRKMEIVN